MGFEFPKTAFRAQCTNVVDGDTIDVYIDQGRRNFSQDRIRLIGIDTPELKAKDPAQRAGAKAAKEQMIKWCQPAPISSTWPLLVTLEKDPDNFGRWLATLVVQLPDGTVIHVNEELIKLGLAVPYKG